MANDSDLNPLDLNQKINQLLKPATPLATKEEHHRCTNAICSIIRKVSKKLSNTIKEKENNTYDKSPKYYHNILKINAGLKPRARDQPRVAALTNPPRSLHKPTHKNS